MGLFFLPNAGVYGSSSTRSQKSLSAKIDAKVCHQLLDPASHDRHRMAHLSLSRIPGAGAWLFEIPDSLESHITAPLFRVSVRRRLRMPIWTQETNCTLCGQVMDKWGDQALVCGCGGDRVTRHSLVRDVVHSAANDRAGLGAVLEKPWLLVPRDPSDNGLPPGPGPDPADPSSPSRRPADVWVPRGPSGGQEAWDFSITSALRLGPALPATFLWVFSSVESRKKTFVNTASQAGISFCPLVIEAVGGGWSDALRSVVSWIAGESNRCSPVSRCDASFKIAQRISCTGHRENARAILKQAREQSSLHCCSLGLSLVSESEHV